VLEKLGNLELLERTAVAFVADHGEEFLEHGRHWHGNHAYGEMLNVPMAIAWPAGLPAGKRVDATVHTIDLMPTLLELSRLPIPAGVQGRSLLPLVVAPEGEGAQQLAARTVFSERRAESYVFNAGMPNNDSLVAISGGWKLIHNIERRTAGEAEYELFDHRADPLNLTNLAARHPDQVSRLRAEIERWQKEALAARAEDAGKAEMSEEERARLRALGYIQ
jgi:arylsulfatase A-like enzyme